MEDYVTLQEIYIHDPKLFKTKNLRSFIKLHKIPDNDIVKLKSTFGIKKSWFKKNLPAYNLKLTELNDIDSIDFFEVQSTLEKYNCKKFNPITLNFDSTMIKYFIVEGKRVPFFTRKGLIKIMVKFNAFQDNLFEWIYELVFGSLQSQINNLENVIETINLDHVPILKNINNNMVLSHHIYNIDQSDIILNFKKIADFKKEKNVNAVIEEYKCPLFTQLQNSYKKGIEEAKKDFNNQIKDLKQEKVIQNLKQELDKERCLKDQVLSLTQSFIPINEVKHSPSPFKSSSNKPVGFIKPSKIV